MNILYLLNESPFSSSSFSEVLTLIMAQDGVLLTGDAVYALQTNSSSLLKLKQLSAPIYVLEEDVSARALQITWSNVKIIDYSQFVKLCTEYIKVVSWL